MHAFNLAGGTVVRGLFLFSYIHAKLSNGDKCEAKATEIKVAENQVLIWKQKQEHQQMGRLLSQCLISYGSYRRYLAC